MKMKNSKEVKKTVKEAYSKMANGGSCCSCGCTDDSKTAEKIAKNIGYSDKELKIAPEANLGLGCGNPTALGKISEGDIVLDLGSGAGIDCFITSKKVGKTGKVIGVDMTEEMVEKARSLAKKYGFTNAEFRLGEIENLPVADNSVDIVMSNCVINLSVDKERVFKEAFRVLKPNGKIMISDIVLLKELPDSLKNSIEAYIGCLSGALLKNKYIDIIKTAGFKDVRIIDEMYIEHMVNNPDAKAIIKNLKIPLKKIKEIASSTVSIKVYGIKPKQ